MDQKDDSWTLPGWNGQPDTTGSNEDGQEDSISKEPASKDAEAEKKPSTFTPEGSPPLTLGTIGPWVTLIVFLKKTINVNR